MLVPLQTPAVKVLPDLSLAALFSFSCMPDSMLCKVQHAPATLVLWASRTSCLALT